MKLHVCIFIQFASHFKPLTSVQAMSLIDSTASFEKRCSDIDESGALLEGLRNQGVRGFSALAYTIGTPQTAPSDRQYDVLAAKISGAEPTLGQVSGLRRLHFESTTLIVASLNEQVKSDSSDPGALIKKLPAAEKQVENSTLKLAQVPVTTTADVGTELKLCWAYQRRGIAFDNCRLLDWHIHDDWVDWVQYLLGAMARDYTAGYSSVRSEQVIKADRELWTILAQEHKATLKPTNDVPALNQACKALTTDPRVTMYLLPLPSSVSKVSNVTAAGPPKAPPMVKPQQGPGINKKRKWTRAQKGCPQELKDFDMKFNQGTTMALSAGDTI